MSATHCSSQQPLRYNHRAHAGHGSAVRVGGGASAGREVSVRTGGGGLSPKNQTLRGVCVYLGRCSVQAGAGCGDRRACPGECPAPGWLSLQPVLKQDIDRAQPSVESGFQVLVSFPSQWTPWEGPLLGENPGASESCRKEARDNFVCKMCKALRNFFISCTSHDPSEASLHTLIS